MNRKLLFYCFLLSGIATGDESAFIRFANSDGLCDEEGGCFDASFHVPNVTIAAVAQHRDDSDMILCGNDLDLGGGNISTNKKNATRMTLEDDFMAGIGLIALSNSDRRDLAAAFDGIPSPYSHTEEHLLESFKRTVSALPSDFIRHVRNFQMAPDAPGALLIRNLPVDANLTDTPPDGGRASHKQTFLLSEASLTGISQLLGSPFSFEGEKSNELIHNICPIARDAMSLSNGGSKSTFSMHTETAFFNERPSYLSLFCLRSDHDQMAGTTFVDARVLTKRLSLEHIEALSQPAFKVRAPSSFEKSHGRVLWSEWRPILSGTLEAPEILVRMPDVTCRTKEAMEAFTALSKVLEDPSVVSKIVLSPGDMLIVNNRAALHGRTAFVPRYDGRDRWLQRVYTSRDISRFQPWYEEGNPRLVKLEAD